MNEDALAGLDLVELYDMLLRPDAPAAISMWPQTVGWIWLLGAVAVLACGLIWAWVSRRRANAYRRAALDALKTAGDDPAKIADVLRRTALAAFPRDDVAQTYGAGWLAFLDQAADQMDFSGSDAGRVLAAAPYSPQTPHGDLPAMAARWIKTHRRAGPA